MVVEGSSNSSPANKPKTESNGKEAASCVDSQVAVVGEKTGKSDGPYYKIHHTKGHDLQKCRRVEQLVEKQKQEYKKQDKEEGREGTSGSDKKGDGGRGGRRGNAGLKKEKPARGREKKEEDEK